MEDIEDQDEIVAAAIAEEDADHLYRAQRLAQADPILRSYLSHAWWVGLRAGLYAQTDRPVLLPKDPFSSAALAKLPGPQPPF